MKSKCLIVAFLVLCLCLSVAPAFAATTQDPKNFGGSVLYNNRWYYISWSATLYNYYYYDNNISKWSYMDHSLAGSYYVGDNSFPFNQGVNGQIDWYDQGAKVKTLYLTPYLNPLYPTGYKPWGGYNNTCVNLTSGGPDYVKALTTWWGKGSLGYTLPATVPGNFQHTYR